MSKTIEQIAKDCEIEPGPLVLLVGMNDHLMDEGDAQIIGRALYRRIEKLEEERDSALVTIRQLSIVSQMASLSQWARPDPLKDITELANLKLRNLGAAEPIYKSGDNKDANGE